MTDNARVERLAWILSEHECWEHPGWNASESRRGLIAEAIEYPQRTGHPLMDSLRAAITEVESGDVFGAPDRCAVCGSPGALRGGTPQWCVCSFGLNSDCDRAWVRSSDGLAHHNADDLIRGILRARKFYRETQAKSEPAKTTKPDDWRGRWASVVHPYSTPTAGATRTVQDEILHAWMGPLGIGAMRVELKSCSTCGVGPKERGFTCGSCDDERYLGWKPKPDDWRGRWAAYTTGHVFPQWNPLIHTQILREWRKRIGWKPPHCTHDWRRCDVAVDRADQPEPHLWTCTKCGRVESRPRESRAATETRIFTGVDYGVDGSCCTVRLRREADGRFTLIDEVYEPRKPQPPDEIRAGVVWFNKASRECARVMSVDRTDKRNPVVVYHDVRGHEQRWSLYPLSDGNPAWRECWEVLGVEKPSTVSTAKQAEVRVEVAPSPWVCGICGGGAKQIGTDPVVRESVCGVCGASATYHWSQYCDTWACWRSWQAKPPSIADLRTNIETLRSSAVQQAKEIIGLAELGKALRSEVDDLRAGEARQCDRNERDLARSLQLDGRVGKLERRFPEGCIVIPVEKTKYGPRQKPTPKRAGRKGAKR